jgi:hypothetical protein
LDFSDQLFRHLKYRHKPLSSIKSPIYKLPNALQNGQKGTVCCVRAKRAHNIQYPKSLFQGSLLILLQTRIFRSIDVQI